MKKGMRRCQSCGTYKEQADLRRVVLRSGTPVFSRAEGRGLYLCREKSCLLKARKKRALERAFKIDGQLAESFWLAVGLS